MDVMLPCPVCKVSTGVEMEINDKGEQGHCDICGIYGFVSVGGDINKATQVWNDWVRNYEKTKVN